MNSIHLEGTPRRQLFREIRERLNSSAGSHTIMGYLRVAQPQQAPDAATIVPAEVKVQQAPSNCFIMDRGKKLPLRIGMNSIGRLPDNDVVIEDPTVSRRHCAILVHSDLSCELHDVASKNGTMLNGKRIAGPTALSDGDEITLCDRKIHLLIGTSNHNPRSVSPMRPLSNSSATDRTQIS